MDIRGFYVWLCSNLTLLVLHIASGLWLLALLDVAYFRLNLYGILRWKQARSVS